MAGILKKAAIIAVVGLAWLGIAAELVPGIELRTDGRLAIGGKNSGVTLGLAHYGPGWKNGSMQNKQNCSVEISGNNYKGSWKISGGTFDVDFKIKTEETLQAVWRMVAAKPVPTGYLGALIMLPREYEGSTVTINGKAVILTPAKSKTENLVSIKSRREGTNQVKLQINGIRYTFSTPNGIMLYVSPSRNNGSFNYGIRFRAEPFQGDISSASLNIEVVGDAVVSDPIDISTAANRAFTDQVAEDHKGGWTDQGKERDLRSLRAGKIRLGGVVFDILDNRKTKGRSCIVLRGAPRPYFPEQAVVKSVAGKRFKKLYLLHATAWGNSGISGYIDVDYADGSKSEIKVTGERDVSDWTGGQARLANAIRVWQGSTPGAGAVGLYLSAFNLEDKKLKQICFRSSGAQPVWMIAAVTGSPDADNILAVAPVLGAGRQKIYRADDEWKAIKFETDKVIPGTAIDFSRFLDAPAGKYGEVIIRDGKFRFKNAPEKPIRFYGTNLTHGSMYHDKEYAPRYAAKLAAEGINVVRIHMYENGLGNPGLAAKEGSTEFNPVEKDKLDFLLSELRKRGIYYILTIYSGAWFPAGTFTDTPGFENRRIRFQIKPLAMISDQARDYMRKWGKNLLLSVNPYTGLAPKDDPALISVELTNENPLNAIDREYPEFTALFTDACRRYLARRDGREPSPEEVKRFYMIYLMVVLHCDFYSDMHAYLRSIGVNKPIGDINNRPYLAYAVVRNMLDYVDVHSYFDLYKYVGAKFSGGMFDNALKVYRLRGWDPLRSEFFTQTEGAANRIFGKPFSVGEYNMCYPAEDRAFMTPLQASLSGLQGHQIILHYGYASKTDFISKAYPERWLNLATSPLFLYTQRIGCRLFGTRGVETSKVGIPIVLTRSYIDNRLAVNNIIHVPKQYGALGFICKIGTILADDSTDLSQWPAVVIPGDMKSSEMPAGLRQVKYFRASTNLVEELRPYYANASRAGLKLSTTGELKLDSADGAFAAVTPESECLLLQNGTEKMDGRVLAVSGNSSGVATVFASALDDMPLVKSKRMVLLYLTDLKNTGCIINWPENNSNFSVVYDQGRLPYLLKVGKIRVDFRVGDGALPEVYALKYTGERAFKIPVEKTAGGFAFTANAVSEADTYFAYEIVRPQ